MVWQESGTLKKLLPDLDTIEFESIEDNKIENT